MVNEEILKELERFINILDNSQNLQVNSFPETIQCCINLLGNVPASKEPIFEYFERIFETSVSMYLNTLESDTNNFPTYDEAIHQIQDALEVLIYQGQHAWVDLISVWSLDSLGKLSSTYRPTRNMDINTACNIWLGSTAMNCLLELAARCFEQSTPSEVEHCTKLVVNIYAQNSPYFDWVVVRLGAYFPCNIVSKILYHGLTSFTENSRSGLDSEVGILSYLSFAQETYLKTAIKKLIEGNFCSDSNSNTQLKTMLYLLHLCRKSDILLQTIGAVFLDICLCDDSLLKMIVNKLSLLSAPEYHSIEYFSYISNLLLRLNKGATTFILKLAKTSEISLWCQDLLEYILQEIENDTVEEKVAKVANDITDDHSKLALFLACIEGLLTEQQTAIRLILFSPHQTPHIIYQITAKLLRHPYSSEDNRGFGSLIKLLGKLALDSKLLTSGLHFELDHILFRANGHLETKVLSENLNVLKNLLMIIRWEKRNQSTQIKSSLLSLASTKFISTVLRIGWVYLCKNMDNSLFANSSHLKFNDQYEGNIRKKLKLNYSDLNEKEFEKEAMLIDEHVHLILALLNTLEVGGKEHSISLGDNMKLLELIVKYLFSNIDQKDIDLHTYAMHCSCSILSRLCLTRKYSRIIALQELIEGALYVHNHLFEPKDDRNGKQVMNTQRNNSKSLIKLNQSQNSTQSTLRCVLHAGVIGQGLKNPIKEADEPISAIKNCFLSSIIACCDNEDIQKRYEGLSMVSTLLIELISSDVMYNGIPWPDEDFCKVTMERDLQIRRSFKNTPILWHIVAYIASNRPALCSASVLLRAICASLLHQWRAKSVLLQQNTDKDSELCKVTVKFLQIMAMGQLLPPPLDYLHVIIESFEPHEIAVILKECVWNYVKENIMSASALNGDNKSTYYREKISDVPANFIDPLRNIMQRKLSTLGSYYHHMFVLPQLSQIKQEVPE